MEIYFNLFVLNVRTFSLEALAKQLELKLFQRHREMSIVVYLSDNLEILNSLI